MLAVDRLDGFGSHIAILNWDNEPAIRSARGRSGTRAILASGGGGGGENHSKHFVEGNANIVDGPHRTQKGTTEPNLRRRSGRRTRRLLKTPRDFRTGQWWAWTGELRLRWSEEEEFRDMCTIVARCFCYSHLLLLRGRDLGVRFDCVVYWEYRSFGGEASIEKLPCVTRLQNGATAQC